MPGGVEIDEKADRKSPVIVNEGVELLVLNGAMRMCVDSIKFDESDVLTGLSALPGFGNRLH